MFRPSSSSSFGLKIYLPAGRFVFLFLYFRWLLSTSDHANVPSKGTIKTFGFRRAISLTGGSKWKQRRIAINAPPGVECSVLFIFFWTDHSTPGDRLACAWKNTEGRDVKNGPPGVGWTVQKNSKRTENSTPGVTFYHISPRPSFTSIRKKNLAFGGPFQSSVHFL